MEQHGPCDKLVSTAERVSTLEANRTSDHSWIEDLHSDHENTKKELNKMRVQIAVIVASATFFSNLLYGVVDRVLPVAKAVATIVFPNAFGGQIR